MCDSLFSMRSKASHGKRRWSLSSLSQAGAKPKNKGAGAFLAPNGKMVEIRDVWRDNLDEEMINIRKVLFEVRAGVSLSP